MSNATKGGITLDIQSLWVLRIVIAISIVAFCIFQTKVYDITRCIERLSLYGVYKITSFIGLRNIHFVKTNINFCHFLLFFFMLSIDFLHILIFRSGIGGFVYYNATKIENIELRLNQLSINLMTLFVAYNCFCQIIRLQDEARRDNFILLRMGTVIALSMPVVISGLYSIANYIREYNQRLFWNIDFKPYPRDKKYV